MEQQQEARQKDIFSHLLSPNHILPPGPKLKLSTFLDES